MRSSSVRSSARVAAIPASALALALIACSDPLREEPTWLVAEDPGAEALVRALGWTDRLLDPDAARASEQRVLWLPGPEDPDPPAADTRRVRRSPLVTFDAIFALAREMGSWLGEESAAERWITATQQELARISASSLDQERPYVAIVLTLEPIRLAGARRFEAELVEIAGAENLTHDSDTLQLGIDALPPEHRSPDLWLFVPPRMPDDATRSRLRARLPGFAPIEVFPLPPGWLSDIVGHAERLHARIAATRDALSERRDRSASPEPYAR